MTPAIAELPEVDFVPLAACFVRVSGDTRVGECGDLLVQESVSGFPGRVISLPIIRIRADTDAPDHPIFFLGGGPGQSNMEFRPPPELLTRHDFVMVGYRGVDGSGVLACREVARAMRGRGPNLLADASLAHIGDAFAGCAERHSAAEVDLAAYTMLDVVRDMESARRALGYERVSLLSASYGTRVAQIYAQQHPARIHRSVMVAANPPGRFVWEPAMVDRQLAAYSRLCASDAYCKGRSADLSRSMRSVTADMPKRWLFLPIDPGKVRVASFALLFKRDTAALVFDAFLAAERGDPSGLALMSLAYDFVLPSMFVWGDMAAKAGSADFDPKRNYRVEMDPPESILGAPFSKLLWSTSALWPITSLGEQYRHSQPSAVETLLISGNLDFSTPAEFAAEELFPFLSKGHHLILGDLGHVPDLLTRQRPATRQLLSTFYASGLVDDSSIVHMPMDFRVGFGLPMLAKLGLAVIVLLAVVVLGLAWRVARRIRRAHRRGLTGARLYGRS